MQNKINAFTSKSMNLVAIKNNYISNYMGALYFLAMRIIGKTKVQMNILSRYFKLENERRPKKMEDDLKKNGRRPQKWKTTSKSGRRPKQKWKTTSKKMKMEDDLTKK